MSEKMWSRPDLSIRNTVHGLSKHPLYLCWKRMRQRCLNKNNHRYIYYGARGIKICKRWDKFLTFYRDLADHYKPGLELDRINNDGNYKPSNVRFATRRQQVCNSRQNKILTYKGKKYRLPELADMAGVSCKVFRERLTKCRWTVEKAVNTPLLR